MRRRRRDKRQSRCRGRSLDTYHAHTYYAQTYDAYSKAVLTMPTLLTPAQALRDALAAAQKAEESAARLRRSLELQAPELKDLDPNHDPNHDPEP